MKYPGNKKDTVMTNSKTDFLSLEIYMEITIKLPFFQSSIVYLAFSTSDASPFRLAINNIKESK